ncbi:hypothetical protein GQ600_24992 [Phytophthora cactorum]|nr:hypothetical protein GQ600_24992 [Phytophthora cactorum]
MTQVEIRSASPIGSPTSPSSMDSPGRRTALHYRGHPQGARLLQVVRRHDRGWTPARGRRLPTPQGFVCINWHHVECYKSVRQIPLKCLEGFSDLDPQQQKVVESYHLAKSEPQYLPEARTCSA